jgi:hypothetical protein
MDRAFSSHFRIKNAPKCRYWSSPVDGLKIMQKPVKAVVRALKTDKPKCLGSLKAKQQWVEKSTLPNYRAMHCAVKIIKT